MISSKVKICILCLFCLFSLNNFSQTKASNKFPFAIVIHGGAGAILKKYMTPKREIAYKNKLKEALNTGYQILANGGSSLDAVQKTINILEDSPLFNAGKGAVLNNKGLNEMDASIMDGKTLNAGAVAGVSHIKNPINAARLVMEKSKYILLSGDGAEVFAKDNGLILKDSSYFILQKRVDQLRHVQNKELHNAAISYPKNSINSLIDNHKYSTVGCVAIDKYGNIAAGTSTGGLTNKKFGRIGDSPIIGAGTYANNATCGVSCTGIGEYFMRTVASHEVSALMAYKNYTLKEALKKVIHIEIAPLGGVGGMIAIDKKGNIAWDFNTKGMFRGYKSSDGKQEVKFYGKED